MMYGRNLKTVSRSCLFLIMALLAGCQTSQGLTTTAKTENAQVTEQKVMARAQARWNALLAKDLDKAYDFLSPAMRSTMSRDVYKLRINPSFWRGAKVKSATCREEVCDVKVEIAIMALENLSVDQVLEEKWIFNQGQWWFVYQG